MSSKQSTLIQILIEQQQERLGRKLTNDEVMQLTQALAIPFLL